MTTTPKKSEWYWTEKQEEGFNEIKKKITEIPCLENFARAIENVVSTDSNRTGRRITLWQKQNDDTIRPIAFTSRYLNNAQKNYSIGELELLAVVWGLGKFAFTYTVKWYIYIPITKL